MSQEEIILYEVRGKVAVITLNIPHKLNALNAEGYLLLGKLMERADAEEDTIVTLIQSSGRFFSAGADFSDKALAGNQDVDKFDHEFWLGRFVGRNAWLTDLFHNHTKVLVSALNGPVIGLSAALVALSDLIYVIDEAKVYVLTPFSNLGLVAEGASSATLFLRLGWSKASEALLFARPIPGAELTKLGFINKSYGDYNFKSVEEFNKKIYDDLVAQFDGLYEPSVLANKQLLKANRDKLITSANSTEVVGGFNKWKAGAPQRRFVQLSLKQIKHKL